MKGINGNCVRNVCRFVGKPVPVAVKHLKPLKANYVANHKYITPALYHQNPPHCCSTAAELPKLNFAENNFLSCLRLTKRSGSKSRNGGLQYCPERNFSQRATDERRPPLPKLLYIQNPLVWISNKIDFRFLRHSWDPTFNEEEFTRGARQAIATVTQMVSKNRFEHMKPLLTRIALINLRRDVEILWADEVRRNISLQPEDVQLIIPRKIHFRQSTDKRFCDIDVLFIAMKWLEDYKLNTPLVFVEIVARFHRNYTEGIPPDWTIAAFKVRRFNLMPQKT